jgi:hypothetical protein
MRGTRLPVDNFDGTCAPELARRRFGFHVGKNRRGMVRAVGRA